MYLEHYGLSAKPFSLNPDPDYLFFSVQHSRAYGMLEHGLLSQPGITVISGDVGAGKTTLLHHLLNQHKNSDTVIGMIADTDRDTGKDLLASLSLAFSLDCTGTDPELKSRLQDFIAQNYMRGMTTVLIVDEAQNLKKKALEKLRLLNNLNSGESEPLKIILVGQPQLITKLRDPGLEQLAQRVGVEFNLSPLNPEATLGYIRHRLKVAGARINIFGNAAMYGIYYLAGGIPRLINTLCDDALIYAFSRGERRITIDSVLEVARGRKIGGINHLSNDSPERSGVRRYILEATQCDVNILALRDDNRH